MNILLIAYHFYPVANAASTFLYRDNHRMHRDLIIDWLDTEARHEA